MQQLEINSKNEFSFNHLNSTQFEEFCFELLERLGFRNVNWRKGTGHASSPSDQGRDIECERVVEDVVDGELIVEKWFVECKHYKSGVPPEKIQGVLSWANSKRPDRVLIIASNFLSNQCKNFLDEYVRENKPPFKIKTWEKKDLERLTQGQSLLLKKYNVGYDFSFIYIMHPNHLLYIKDLHTFTLDSFFKFMDGVEATKRDKILDYAYTLIIKPRFRKPTTIKETWEDLLIDEVSYENFKSKCYETEKQNKNISVATYVTDIVLKTCFGLGDTTTLDQSIKNLESLRESLQNRLLKEKGLENNSSAKIIESALEKINRQLDNMADQNEEYRFLYNFFCENALSFLFAEEMLEMINIDSMKFKDWSSVDSRESH